MTDIELPELVNATSSSARRQGKTKVYGEVVSYKSLAPDSLDFGAAWPVRRSLCPFIPWTEHVPDVGSEVTWKCCEPHSALFHGVLMCSAHKLGLLKMLIQVDVGNLGVTLVTSIT